MQPGPSNVGRQPGRHGTARRQTRARQQRATHRARHARAVFSTKLPSPARRAGNSSRHYCRRAGSYRKQVERQATEKRDRSQPPSRTYYRRCLRRGQASPNNTEVRQLPGQECGVCEEETAERFEDRPYGELNETARGTARQGPCHGRRQGDVDGRRADRLSARRRTKGLSRH